MIFRMKGLGYLIVVALLIAAPLLMTSGYLRHLLVLFVIFAIMTLGLDVLVGRVGDFALGQQAFFGLGAFASALLATRLGMSPWLGLVGACVFTGILGGLLCGLSQRTKGAYLAIITFGFAMIVQVVAFNLPSITGGYYGLRGIPSLTIAPPFLPKLDFATPLTYYYLAIVIGALVVYFLARLYSSKPGRAMIAIGKNEELARSVGIDVFKYKVLAFCIGSMLAGLAGSLYAHYMLFITNEVLGIHYLFSMMVMLMVGGRGTLWGPVIGAAIFVFLPEYLRIVEQIRLILFGVIVIACMVLMPGGIYPALASFWHRLASKFRGAAFSKATSESNQ